MKLVRATVILLLSFVYVSMLDSVRSVIHKQASTLLLVHINAKQPAVSPSSPCEHERAPVGAQAPDDEHLEDRGPVQPRPLCVGSCVDVCVRQRERGRERSTCTATTSYACMRRDTNAIQHASRRHAYMRVCVRTEGELLVLGRQRAVPVTEARARLHHVLFVWLSL